MTIIIVHLPGRHFKVLVLMTRDIQSVRLLFRSGRTLVLTRSGGAIPEPVPQISILGLFDAPTLTQLRDTNFTSSHVSFRRNRIDTVHRRETCQNRETCRIPRTVPTRFPQNSPDIFPVVFTDTVRSPGHVSTTAPVQETYKDGFADTVLRRFGTCSFTRDGRPCGNSVEESLTGTITANP